MEMYGMTGERLGTIGSSDKKADHMPKWQRDFMTKPSISIRKGIAWGYNPPYEDTDTLVLTAASSIYIDIRLPKQIDSSRPLLDQPSFWAFTGKSTTTFPGTTDTPMKHVAHGAWQREIDSKGVDIVDEGDMFELPNGDVAEVGMMENPNTGKVEMYKEYWTAPGTAQEEEIGSKVCIVAKVVDQGESGGYRGLVVRVGNYCQGIVESKKPGSKTVLAIDRWTRSRSDASWEQDPRSGSVSFSHLEVSKAIMKGIPCSWVCEESRSKGDEIELESLRWRVTEASR